MSDIWDCEYYARCLNKERCLVCGPNSNFRLLKLPEDKQRLKAQQRQRTGYGQKATLHSDDSWKHLEQSVANDLNALPTYREARRQIRSGGLWFMPGDVDDTDVRIECKEREAYDSKGKKTFSILKDVLDKIIAEARSDNKFPGLIFRYKGEPDRYAVLPWEELLSLVHQFKVHYLEVKALEKERDMYKQQARQLQEELEKLKGGKANESNS
jgi:hypothetical protein